MNLRGFCNIADERRCNVARRSVASGHMNNLRELREKAKISAAALGEMIDAAESTVTAWERNTRSLPAKKAQKIIEALEACGVYASFDVLYRRKAA